MFSIRSWGFSILHPEEISLWNCNIIQGVRVDSRVSLCLWGSLALRPHAVLVCKLSSWGEWLYHRVGLRQGAPMCAHPHLSQCALTPSLSFPDARLLTIALLRTSVFLPPGSLLSGRLCFPRFPNSSHLSVLSRARTSELPLQSLFCILLAHKNCVLIGVCICFYEIVFCIFFKVEREESKRKRSSTTLLPKWLWQRGLGQSQKPGTHVCVFHEVGRDPST